MITINPNKVQLPDAIALGQKFVVEAGFGPDEKVTLFDALLNAKEAAAKAGNPELVATTHPKTVAVYTWMQTVKGMAKAGITEGFPSAPFTFNEVVTE